jgi:hypothetical protein
MCKCNPNIRTPFCGKGDCVWPKPDVQPLTKAEQLEAMKRAIMINMDVSAMWNGMLRETEDGWKIFYCPGCMKYHYVDDRWMFNGNYEKPTFTPSIHVGKLTSDSCHFFVRDGMIEYLPDCHHALAGTKVPMERGWLE